MIKKKQTFLNPLKGPNQSNPKLEVEEKANSFNKNHKSLQHRYKKTNTLMMTLIITITVGIIEVNPEAVDLIEAKILVNFSEVKICVVEVNAAKTHTKANIRVIAIKAIITKATVVYIITHIEIFNKVIIMANLEVEAMVVAEVITKDAVTVGPIIKAITTTNTVSIMVMMMSTRQINMAHHVCYAVAIITPPNIVLRENMILMIKMNISGHQLQSSGLYS